MNENTITLTFADKETADYVRLVCTRKSISLADYVVDNFEWDDKPECIALDEKPNIYICAKRNCQFAEDCPDAVKRKKRKKR
jgi:hypothetical protein